MHFGSAKGEGHVNVCPPSYTLNKHQLYSWGTQCSDPESLIFESLLIMNMCSNGCVLTMTNNI